MISSSLEKFAWKKDNLAACRCPICGDSQKNKNRVRGYFYQKGNNLFYRCHNCGVSTTMYKFLEMVSPSLCKEYSLDRWKSGENGHSNYTKPEFKFEQPVFERSEFDIPKISSLPDDHECRKYVEDRHIPEEYWQDLYYAENFYEFVQKYDESKFVGQEPRLIIPLRNIDGKLIGFQGRAIYSSQVKYITIKFDSSTQYISYGVDKVDINKQVFVVEGPIDSMFLPNSIAILGMNHELDPIVKDPIFVLDNEPRNFEVVKQYQKLIDQKRNICIWPESIKQKDINDMVLSGIKSSVLATIIRKNTFSGPEALMRMVTWKKI